MRPLKFKKVSACMLDEAKYCLLEDGSIEPTHYPASEESLLELREFVEDEHGNLCLLHDKWLKNEKGEECAVALCSTPVFKLGATKEELKPKGSKA